MMNANINDAEWNEMFITEHLVQENLPELLKDFLTVGKTTQEKDILLLSALTTLSSAFPNLYMRYGHTGKLYYPNLQTFIMAGAASGKGIANLARQLVEPLHEQHSLIIPGDSTYPAFYQVLLCQAGKGLLFETEGSVITDIWKSGCTTYNTALRKAAEHEPLSKNRILTGETEIPTPKVSMLLTGTFEQFQRLVPSVENGYFSRLNMLVLKDQPEFDETIFCPSEQSAEVQHLIKRLGNQVLRLHESMPQGVEFRLTHEQGAQIGVIMKKEYHALMKRLGSGFHATIIRNGVTLMRLAAILTALRGSLTVSSDSPSPEGEDAVITCSNEDFQTAVMIATKLLHHAAEAYQQIGGLEQMAVPAIKGSYQKETFLATLPEEFTTGECIARAKLVGISQRSAERWISSWRTEGMLKTCKAGQFQKVA